MIRKRIVLHSSQPIHASIGIVGTLLINRIHALVTRSITIIDGSIIIAEIIRNWFLTIVVLQRIIIGRRIIHISVYNRIGKRWFKSYLAKFTICVPIQVQIIARLIIWKIFIKFIIRIVVKRHLYL
jgi:hypothetical protein